MDVGLGTTDIQSGRQNGHHQLQNNGIRHAQASSSRSPSASPTAAYPPQIINPRSRYEPSASSNNEPLKMTPTQRSFSNDSYQRSTSPIPTISSIQHKPSEASRLRMLNSGQATTGDLRYRTEPPPLENFSRPRNASLKGSEELPRAFLHSASTFPLQAANDPISRPFRRDRGMSASSSQSSNIPYKSVRNSISIPDLTGPDRSRNVSTYSAPRNQNGYTESFSSQRREPPVRPIAYDEEEVRASFRSAQTTGSSSFLGTSGTERSSVLTKSSSATSIYGRDEGMTVDDAIGMYESGFGDSGTEDDYPKYKKSFQSERSDRTKLADQENDVLALPKFSNLIIRDSSEMFRPHDSYIDPFDGEGDAETPQAYEYSRRPPITGNEGEPPESSAPRPSFSKFDSTRDRYGFKKKSQYVSLADYEAWNAKYTEYLARRREKWIKLMEGAAFSPDKPVSFPPKSSKMKRFVRKGIPPDWRGAAWWWYAGGAELLAHNIGVYDDLVRRAQDGEVSQTDEEIIERDLHRTFPDNIRFKPDPVTIPGQDETAGKHISRPDVETPILKSLRRVLQAMSIHNPKIGYCQSLNFLAGLLLLFMDEEKSFWMLNIITQMLPGTHEVNLEGANVDLGVLMISVKESMPQIWSKIGGELDGSGTASNDKVSMRLPPITLCLTAWFMSCYIGTLPIETTLRVWDSLFYEGSKTLFRIALAIFKVGEQTIKSVSDPMEIFQVVQTIPRRLVDASALMEACYKRRNGFGHLSQNTIEARRRERRRGYADERARAEGRLVGSARRGMFSSMKARGRRH